MGEGIICMKDLKVCNSFLGNPHQLREFARDEGYLYFINLIPDEDILDVRKDILELCYNAGWMAPAQDIMDGIARPGIAWNEGSPEYMKVYNKLQCLESFHTLPHHPNLITVLRKLFEEEPLPHARNIARIVFPHNTGFTTPAHQDFIHVQGAKDTWTTWIPLGECPQELGTLAVMPGSHKQGLYPVHSAYGAGGLGIDTSILPFQWTSLDMHTGDVLMFSSMTVHKALPNVSPDQIRLSVDYRYQRVSDPASNDSFEPHFGQISWEEVYRNWHSAKYKYYWMNKDVHFVENLTEEEKLKMMQEETI
jgi:hypothetical protein